MILTQDKINTAILKATCAMASKSSKYYRGLAVGTKNDCLIKEANLLNQYIDSIKCFKIVGSTEQCNCSIEGDYKVILPNNKIYYFQFSCDNKGYLLTEDNGGYDFTYCYDESNNQLVMSFNDDSLVITFDDVNFTEECNFTYNGSFPWYYQALLEVTGTPVLTDDGLMTIKDLSNNDIVPPLVIPSSLLTNPQDIVDYWNANRASTNFTLSYNGTEYVMESPADFVNYYNDTFNFTQTENVNVPVPGNKATATCTNTQVGDKNQGKILKAYVNSSEIGSYTILSGDSLDTAAQLAVKLENTFTYAGTSSVTGANINLTAPTDGTAYNGTTYELKLITPEVLPTTADIVIVNTGGNTNSFQVILDSTSQILGQVNNTGLLTNVQLAAAISASINSGTGTHGFSATYTAGLDSFRLKPPIGSGNTYGFAEIILQCNPDPGSTIETNVVFPVVGTRSIFFTGGNNEIIVNVDNDTFSGGTNPTSNPEEEPVTYTSNFDVIVDDELTYENLNPCFEELIETAFIQVTGTPVLSGYNGIISINNYNNDPIYSLIIPSNIITNPQAIVDLWNSSMTYSGFTLAYENGEYIFTSPVDNNYSSWTAQFKQYEGGQSANTLLVDPIPQPFITSGIPATTQFLVTGSDMLNNSTTQNFNLNGNLLFAHSGQFTTPESVETWFNTNTLDYSIQYDGPQLGPETLATASNNFIGTVSVSSGQTVRAYIDFIGYVASGWKSGVNYIGEYIVQSGDTQLNIWSGLRNNILNRPNGISTSFEVNAIPTPGDILNITYGGGISVLGGPLTAGVYSDIPTTAQTLRDVINSAPGNIWSAQSNLNFPGELIITLNLSTPNYGNYNSINLIANTTLGPSWSFVNPIRRLMRNYFNEGGGVAPFDPLNPYQITLTALPGSESNWNNPNVTFSINSIIGVDDISTYFTGGLPPSPNGNYFYTVSSPDLDAFTYNGDTFSITYSSSPTINFGSFSGGSSSTIGFLYWELILPSGSTVVYQDTTPVNYASLQEIVDAFNDSPNNFGFTATLQGNDININAPINTFQFYNGSEVILEYNYLSEYPTYEDTVEFGNGVNPTLISYIGQFENQKPLVEQTCLSNEQVIKIINNINGIAQ